VTAVASRRIFEQVAAMILSPSEEALDRAAAAIRAGEVVAFPTETVYGLGADATNARAVARVFEIKARPAFDPLIVHLGGHEMLAPLVGEIPPPARDLASRFWPGPLTLVLRKTERIPDIVTAGLPSVAVRVPDHPVARALISRAERPIAAPSANPFGYVSPTTAAHVERQLGERIGIILDGGPCRVGVESTIVSFLEATPHLLRPGGLPVEEIEKVIGAIDLSPTPPVQPLAPGQLPRHYAPHARLVLIDSPAEVPAAARAHAALLLPFPHPDSQGFAHVEILAERGDLTTAAVNLFAALRRLDEGGHERIYAVRTVEEGLGRAIMDRLRRAAR
jgi:L-threonylcarbamoyladenylate synthase